LVRFLLTSILLLVSFEPVAAQEQGQLDASRALFSVLCAVNAVGYDADLGSPSNHPFRETVRKELASKNIPSLEALKRFFADHRQKDWTAELSQYVSFALVVDGPPAFNYRLMRNELPPDVVPLEGLPLLMARFHREADLDSLWRRAQPHIDEVIARYHEPVTRAVTEVSAYLRNVTSGYSGGRFQIYVDLLGAPNQIQSRSYANEYFLVITPSPEPQVEDVRHAYLHHLLDSLATRHAGDLMEKKALGDYALAAPFLPDYYKSDFLLLATESLIKAVESRVRHVPAQKKQALVQQALNEGFILAPHFAEQLPLYEGQDRAMRFYFRELVSSIDLKKEEQRLENLEFPEERPVRKAKVVPAKRKIEPTGAYRTMEDAEQSYSKRQLEKARQGYLQVLNETDEKLLHAKAYYGLARIAALNSDPELAETLFQRTLKSSPDPHVRAWTLVYLGRLADLADERQQAGEYYRTALAVEGASAAARKAAEKGLQASFKRDK
jgi:tetratricopeptide (TPR) repeat protein